MTVREYIEELKKLDQDKGIWCTYDFPCAMFDPIPDGVAEQTHVDSYGEELGVKVGDYLINAG